MGKDTLVSMDGYKIGYSFFLIEGNKINKCTLEGYHPKRLRVFVSIGGDSIALSIEEYKALEKEGYKKRSEAVTQLEKLSMESLDVAIVLKEEELIELKKQRDEFNS